MRRKIWTFFIVLFILPSSHCVNLICDYCDPRQCQCIIELNLLNCSSYIEPLTMSSNCSTTNIWNLVDFSSRNIEYLNAEILFSLKMTRLSLKSNNIKLIGNRTFDAVSDVLNELDLSANHLVNVSSDWLNAKLNRLKILDLASNRISQFLDSDSVQLESLEILNVSHNEIENFPKVIHKWTSLTSIDLSFNHLRSIPRFALVGLNNLTWLSMAGNKNLACVVQDSFKYLKALKHLDLSNTNLVDLDPCIFIPLSGLRIFRLENLRFNCSSCWLPVSRKYSTLQIFGQCTWNNEFQSLSSLSHQQLDDVCKTSSIECPMDFCEPGSIVPLRKTNRSTTISRSSSILATRSLEIILGSIFGVISLLLILISILILIRWRQGKKLFCCKFFNTKTDINKAKRRRREQEKEIIDRNPAVIESVVTHGANMNIQPKSYENSGFDDRTALNNKRKLFNPMFTETTQEPIDNSNKMSSDEQFYSSEYL